MNPFRGKVQSMSRDMMSGQAARYRPDEEPEERDNPNERLRGSKIKLSSRGDRKQHKRKSRRRR